MGLNSGLKGSIKTLKCTEVYEAIPIQTYNRSIGFQVVEAPRSLDSRHMKVIMLLALHNGCLYPPYLSKYSSYTFLSGDVSKGHIAAGK
jgi:hypothetical protein